MPSAIRIPEGKKRYTLTLTETTVTGLHSWFAKTGAPKSMLSTMVDELMLDVLKTFAELEAAQKRKGSPVEVGDLFSVIGKLMTEKDEDQRKLIK